MNKLAIVAALTMLSAHAWAQYTLSGTVSNAKKEPLREAFVTVDAENTTTTDEQGRFTISNLKAGEHSIVVRYLGYADYPSRVVLTTDQAMEIVLSEKAFVTDEVIVTALRANENTPTTYYNIDKKTISRQNFGQDLPFLLNWTPSLVTTSDAGTGVGYTGLRIRGSDATHINVTINGIPYNDSESQSVYWVDVPDIASSTESIQVQRGVGTSTNGAGAFGGTVNVQTNTVQKDPYAEVGVSYGSFNTQKYTVKAGTGLIHDAWSLDGRISKIKSDGYIERATSDLDSYYLSGGYFGKRTMVKAVVFGGHEQTYQSWYGIDPAMMAIDRRFNYAGALYDSGGNVSGYYKQQVDDYRQDHYQLHVSHVLSDRWSVNAAVHYTYGRGYFEEYLQGMTYADMGLNGVVVGSDTITSGDFITRQWLDNRFYGATYSLSYSGQRTSLTLGGALNRYGNAKHWGEIIWAQYAGPIQMGQHYYDAVSQKDDFNFYAKLNHNLSDRLNGFIDLQYRGVGYTSSGLADDQTPYNIDDHFNFFNPKVGLSYAMNSNDVLYSSYSVAHREPTRADYLGGSEKPRAEELGNLEAGWRRNSSNYRLEINYYLMNYRDQLVLTGQLNSGGYPIRANVGKSYRTGVEISGTLRLGGKLRWNANATWSVNKNKEYVETDISGSPKTYTNTDIVLSPNWIAGSQWIWNPVSDAEVAFMSKFVGSQYLDNTQQAAVKMDSYFLNDIRLLYTFHPSSMKGLDLGILLNNIFNVQYSSNGAAYGGVPYFYPQAGRNYLLRLTMRF